MPAMGTQTSTKLDRKADLKFYDFGRVLSFNAVYNFICGSRGLGKTYGAKNQVLRNWVRKGEQFIYLRRYTKELAAARNSFLADLALTEDFPDHEFRINGSLCEGRPRGTEGKGGWETVGYFVALSTAQSQKSVAFPKVTVIIFDEFIIEKGAVHYLSNEDVAFHNFYNTVDRYKDKTIVLFLSNAVTITNPYFIGLDINPDRLPEFARLHDGFVVTHFVDSKEFSTGVYKTRFGKFIQGTEYAAYAVGNEFNDAGDNMVSKKNPHSRYSFTLETTKGTYSFWEDYEGRQWFVQSGRPKDEFKLTLIPEKVSKTNKLLTHNDRLAQNLRRAFNNGLVWFDSPKARNAFIEVFKR